MSNFGKIKNIWTLDVVSREEMKTILQEWDDALTSLQSDVSELKRLTTLTTYKDPNIYAGNSSFYINFNPKIDNTKPVYISCEKWDTNNSNKALGSYSFVVFGNDATFTSYNNITEIKIFKQSDTTINFSLNNFNSNIVFKKFTIIYTPKTLSSRVNETQEEGEQWEISK